MSDGAQALDVREPRDFAPGHLRGSINIGLAGQYATWAGTLLDHERPIIIISAPGMEAEAALRLGRIGFDNVAGYLDNGLRALKDREELLTYTPQTSGAAVTRWIGEPDAPFVLDVRTQSEWQQRHIDGSTNIPLNRLREHLNQIPRNRPVDCDVCWWLPVIDGGQPPAVRRLYACQRAHRWYGCGTGRVKIDAD